MHFYDLIHGYQPFDPKTFIPKWVKTNLTVKFLPTSLAMKHGIILRGVQLQGWTIESWLGASSDIGQLATKTLANLKIAKQYGNIEIGTSAYSHAILPMLSSDLIRAQIILDREVVEKFLGKATWFWPPEGAVDKRTLKIVHEIFPDLILLIPDKSLGRYNFHGPVCIKFRDGYQRAIVYSCLFKDLFMNAEDYRKRPKYVRRPQHLPEDLVWARVRRTVHSPKIFLQVLEYLQKNVFVLMRDWENAGSKKGLRKIDQRSKAKDMGVFVKVKDKIDFCLPSQFNWSKAKSFPISKILPASWEMDSTPKDPFPWWQPNKYGRMWRKRKPLRRRRIVEWQELVKEYNFIFRQKVKKYGGLQKALKDKEFKKVLKSTLPAVHSCVGWHYFAKRAWKPYYQHSRQAIERIVLPAIEKMKNTT
ncbi:polysaccharide deacetylase family protein [Patescibacteria group bacterium AH-259-L05]|nr:polysaccharide deacetylase family protein [Patescibacteria group bacterium AH-259-L05]